MNYTIEYNQGFYHALNTEPTSYKDCPYLDSERSTLWLEGYLEAQHELSQQQESNG